MKSVMTTQERFSAVESAKLQRSKFDRSYGGKSTVNSGFLYPIFVDEALPGDTFNVQSTVFGRVATLIKPIMDNIHVDVHYFSVPNRLIWQNFKRFMGEQDKPSSSTDFLEPICTAPTGGYDELSLQDYFTLPTKIAGYEHRSAFLRAYNLIYNEWYRDENLIDSIPVPLDDGPDDPADFVLKLRGKYKDYFTSGLPWAQKADPVSIPLGTSAPVVYHENIAGSAAPVGERLVLAATAGGDFVTRYAPDYLNIDTSSAYNFEADLTDALDVTVNQIRQSVTIQQFYERDARGGTRYTETIKSHFGVTSPDARLQRPEYLGGGRLPLTVNPIPQQSASVDDSTPQGNLAAIGIMSGSGPSFVKTFTEHEIVIGILSITADLTYQQGLERMWSRKTRFDYYWPTFAHLGEQATLMKEIYTTGTSADEEVHSYQERYAEYRYKPSHITGLFRSNATQSLDIWHLSQDFAVAPTLGEAFIQTNVPMNRVVQVPSEPKFIIDYYHKFTAARPMPVFSNPGLSRF